MTAVSASDAVTGDWDASFDKLLPDDSWGPSFWVVREPFFSRDGVKLDDATWWMNEPYREPNILSGRLLSERVKQRSLSIPLGGMRFVFNFGNYYPDAVYLFSNIHVSSDKFSSFEELRSDISFELATEWLTCLLVGKMKRTERLVGVYRDVAFMGGQWWGKVTRYEDEHWKSLFYAQHTFTLFFYDVWELMESYSDAFALSEKFGLPVDECWDVVMGRVAV